MCLCEMQKYIHVQTKRGGWVFELCCRQTLPNQERDQKQFLVPRIQKLDHLSVISDSTSGSSSWWKWVIEWKFNKTGTTKPLLEIRLKTTRALSKLCINNHFSMCHNLKWVFPSQLESSFCKDWHIHDGYKGLLKKENWVLKINYNVHSGRVL